MALIIKYSSVKANKIRPSGPNFMFSENQQTVDKLLAKLKTIRSQNEPDMGEGFSSDAQRKAAFASGYKEKDKKESKTATGEKPTKVELDPKVK